MADPVISERDCTILPFKGFIDSQNPPLEAEADDLQKKKSFINQINNANLLIEINKVMGLRFKESNSLKNKNCDFFLKNVCIN